MLQMGKCFRRTSVSMSTIAVAACKADGDQSKLSCSSRLHQRLSVRELGPAACSRKRPRVGTADADGIGELGPPKATGAEAISRVSTFGVLMMQLPCSTHFRVAVPYKGSMQGIVRLKCVENRIVYKNSGKYVRVSRNTRNAKSGKAQAQGRTAERASKADFTKKATWRLGEKWGEAAFQRVLVFGWRNHNMELGQISAL